MATDQRNLPAFFNTDADFQTWVQGLEAQFSACGMTQTADTGQINSATVAKPAAINTSQGYHIYRFSDSQQSARPLYLKLEYGSSGAATRPSFWVTIGPGSDGAGNLTGTTTTRVQVSGASDKSAGITLPSYCSGDGSRISLVSNYDTSAIGFAAAIVIDRTRDANNNTTSEMVTVTTAGTSSKTQSMYSGGVTSQATSGTFMSYAISTITSGAGLTSLGGNIALIPLIVVAGQMRYLLSACIYNTSDISAVTTVTVNNLGALHTYITLPSISTLPMNVGELAFIWE